VPTYPPFQFTAPPPLSLYIHLPWCVRKCPYCDFNSHALRDALPEQAYVDALLRDLDLEAARADGRPIETIFIGGGTPSLFSAEAIDRLLTGVRQRLALRDDAEITLEANPGAVDEARFVGFRQAGVNRLSIGIQSFDDGCLRRLGRIHGRADAVRAVEIARAAGFDNFNLDLMYGLPEQNLTGALADLDQAIALSPSHISHYQLTLEPNTLFHARPPQLPEDDDIFEMQQACQRMLADAGYLHYEVSAYAKPGQESRHNLNYWTFGDYLAIGAGAHGKITDAAAGEIQRYSKPKHPRDYQARAGTLSATCDERSLQAEDVVLEFMMNALRLRTGFGIALCEQRTGLGWGSFAPMVDAARERNWLDCCNGLVRPTDTGLLYLNELLQLFMPEPA
jgi:putative oxygen-independent coproporphyrinogen III oxidase